MARLWTPGMPETWRNPPAAGAGGGLEPLGFRRAGEPMRVASGRLEIQRLIKIDGSDLLPLDLLLPNDPALVALLEDRQAGAGEGHRLWLLSRAGLRALKRLRGSAQDRADLEALGPEP